MKYSEINLKFPRGTLDCCKYDCKDKECFKGEYCIDLDIANNFKIKEAIENAKNKR